MGATAIVTGVICTVAALGAGIGIGYAICNYQNKKKREKEREKYRQRFKDLDLQNSTIDVNIRWRKIQKITKVKDLIAF